jgi:hypothetical protein
MPASAQQVRSSATGYATIQDSRDDAYREGYRDGVRSDGDSSDSYRHDGQRTTTMGVTLATTSFAANRSTIAAHTAARTAPAASP